MPIALYQVRAVDVKQVGRELGVHYVLEGSVRKAGHKVCTKVEPAMAKGWRLWAGALRRRQDEHGRGMGPTADNVFKHITRRAGTASHAGNGFERSLVTDGHRSQVHD